MGDGAAQTIQVEFEKDPSSYKHWRVEYDGGIAKVIMDVDPDGGLVPGYELKLNSYDLGVDIELADIVRRMRFEHPEVRTVLLSSGNDRAFCAGANITMLGQSSHAWKVNFCKFTNETRCELEDATNNSAQTYIAACNGTTAGGGYELALACKEIYLQDDGNSAVSLPEVPLLGVLPGTGGLTRLVDKRKIRRDLADVFSTTAEGVRGNKAVKWNLVDGVYPRSKFDAKVQARAAQLSAEASAQIQAQDGAGAREGVKLGRLQVELGGDATTTTRQYTCVKLECDATTRIATLKVRGPSEADLALVREGPAAIHKAGDAVWALRAYRELDDALLQLRVNHIGIGLVLVEVESDVARTIAYDQALLEAGDPAKHPSSQAWFTREIVFFMARTLRRMDLTSRSFFAIGSAGTGWGGNLLELALASDRFYLLDDPDSPVEVGASEINWGPLAMSHGHHRLAVRFIGEPDQLEALRGKNGEVLAPEQADEAGLVTMLLDDIDWDDDTRVAIEERVSLSPDALTGMEANLRFPGPENCDSKIFARLTAWQNWIFIRPNATGPEGALTLYGRPERPRFDWERV
ncbi:Benzoyl-CoA-dihydrodiol lyase [Enhygromyxa salina]|uniref:Benzoyl-CoA-dihydrodiol lyase n=1 Tax=Enhygromyxa salina TaxID=215803 RepID=A0A0C2CN14_9BACT|nr:2,3-epoxybenzoyl-CoA dihydrolase [Enhygromyxa salina]KIG12626.1 Benzoyl-CoA-dihydrodiol lyase [Enhygromyxa salina]